MAEHLDLSNKTVKEMDKICNKYGFILQLAQIEKWGYGIYIYYDRNSYLPEIYFDDEEEKFMATVSSNSYLTEQEYDKMLTSLEKGYQCIKELNKVDLTGLPMA